MKIGFAKDIHRFGRNRKLVLGGVNIPYKKGLLAHSDGDVVVHSIVDSILGALNLGDIGKMFPDNDDKYKDYNSLLFLDEIQKILKEKKAIIGNIDVFISCEKPKLAKYTEEMKVKIASHLDISSEKINIKCGTNEKLGYIGKAKGIESYSVVLLKEENE